MWGVWSPCRRNSQALITSVEKSKNISSKDVTNILHSANTSTIWLNTPMSNVETCIYHRNFILFCCMLGFKRKLYGSVLLMGDCFILTKYRSVATETRIKSSPTRTFSPSDLQDKIYSFVEMQFKVFSFRCLPLFACRMNCPPTRLSLAMLLKTHIK